MRDFKAFLLVAVLAAEGLVAAPQESDQPVNAVSFERGAVLLDYSSDYGGRSAANWIALGLVDGTAEIGWASGKGSTFPHQFLFELARPYKLQSLGFDNRQTQESGYPGISAKNVTVSAASESRNGPFTEIYSGEIKPSDVTEVTLSDPVEARWLQLSITGNGGHGEYTELMEFTASGWPTGAERESLVLSGTYETNWNRFYLMAEGDGLKGCYDHDNGVFSGSSSGDFLNLEWREDGPQIGKAVLAITEDGNHFNGLWYEKGKLRGAWHGQKAATENPPKCAAALRGKKTNEVEDALNETGRAVLYGIYFDYDSDVIKSESLKTLQQVRDWLNEHPGKAVVFEGHTDSDGSDDYNQSLSDRRAKSVVGWMTGNGIEAVRLKSQGYGESRPVAANDSAQGKALNRRVEVVVAN